MKFSVGEICEAKSTVGRYEGWREAEITKVGDVLGVDIYGNIHSYDYQLDNEYVSMEPYLRKKPPEQKDNKIADDDWIEDFNKMRKLKEKVTS